MPEWRKYRLENILSIVKNSVKPCNIDECNYIGLEHIAGKSFLLNDIGSSQDAESNKYSFQPNDILYGKLRPYFQKVYKPNFKGICSTDIYVIRTKDERIVSQDFLYQIIREKKFTEWAMEGNTGTRMPRADWQALRKKMVLLPDNLNEQHSIAEILSSLDDKIELNLEMNKTLEEMAIAIYKEWFVDFGPFRDGEFVDSELGPIPKWGEVVNLSDIIQINNKSHKPFEFPTEKFFHYSIPAFDKGNYPKIEFGKDIASNKTSLNDEVILVSKLNPRIRRIWTVIPEDHYISFSSTEFINFQPKNIIDWGYIKYYTNR